jgi:energy-coupling factor transporter ATP-binding protein EcfA2
VSIPGDQYKPDYLVDDVFTPASPATVSYVQRKIVGERFIDALKVKGKQIVVFGHTGNGKTTLIQHVLKSEKQFFITGNCSATTTFSEVVEQGLRDLEETAIVETEVKETHSTEAGISGSIKSISFLRKTNNSSEQKLKKQAVAPKKAGLLTLCHSLGSRGGCWVVEDFHKLPSTEKKFLSQSMKLIMDLGQNYPKFKTIVIGAVATARDVIENDPEMTNRVAEISVPLMTDEELEELIKQGELALNIEFPTDVKQRFVKFSNGVAAVCHSLCLAFCKENGIEQTQQTKIFLTNDRYQKAIERFMNDCSDSLKGRFEAAFKIRRKGRFENAQLILTALAKLDADGADRYELYDKIIEHHPRYPKSNLNLYLDKLQTSEMGNLIRNNTSSGKYRFSEPVQRAYMQALLQTQKVAGTSKAITFEISLDRKVGSPEFRKDFLDLMIRYLDTANGRKKNHK